MLKRYLIKYGAAILVLSSVILFSTAVMGKDTKYLIDEQSVPCMKALGGKLISHSEREKKSSGAGNVLLYNYYAYAKYDGPAKVKQIKMVWTAGYKVKTASAHRVGFKTVKAKYEPQSVKKIWSNTNGTKVVYEKSNFSAVPKNDVNKHSIYHTTEAYLSLEGDAARYCAISGDKKSGSTSMITTFNNSIRTTEKYMYNVMTGRLGIYETNKKTWKPLSTGNVFQYSFTNDNQNYTCGNSSKGEFCLLEVEGNQLKTIYQSKDEKRIFPLAKYEGNNYYLIEQYKSGKRKFTIAVFQDGEMRERFKTEKEIYDSEQINGVFYYTVYTNQEHLYDLYRIDLKKEELTGKRIKVDVGGDLYVHNMQLYLTDKNGIYNKNERFKKKEFNCFYDEKNILMQVYYNEKALLEYKITDLKSKRIMKGVLDVVNFEVENNNLVLYGTGEIKKISLNSETWGEKGN